MKGRLVCVECGSVDVAKRLCGDPDTILCRGCKNLQKQSTAPSQPVDEDPTHYICPDCNLLMEEQEQAYLSDDGDIGDVYWECPKCHTTNRDMDDEPVSLAQMGKALNVLEEVGILVGPFHYRDGSTIADTVARIISERANAKKVVGAVIEHASPEAIYDLAVKSEQPTASHSVEGGRKIAEVILSPDNTTRIELIAQPVERDGSFCLICEGPFLRFEKTVTGVQCAACHTEYPDDADEITKSGNIIKTLLADKDRLKELLKDIELLDPTSRPYEEYSATVRYMARAATTPEGER